jgi:hypothetical protein
MILRLWTGLPAGSPSRGEIGGFDALALLATPVIGESARVG